MRMLGAICTTTLTHLPWQVAERGPWAAASVVSSLGCVAVWQTSSWPPTTTWTSSLRPPPGRTLTTADPRLAQTGVVVEAAVTAVVVEVESIRTSGGCCWVEVGWRRDSGCRKEGHWGGKLNEWQVWRLVLKRKETSVEELQYAF